MNQPALFCEVERPVIKGRMKKTKAPKVKEPSVMDEQLKMLEAKTFGELFDIFRHKYPFNDMPPGLWAILEKASNCKEPLTP